MEDAKPAGLVRGLRRWDLVALFINGVIGAGIFGLPSRVHALIGSWSLLAYALCALLVLGILLCFAEVGSRFRETGGPGRYATLAFGPWVGFEVGWLVWLSRVTAFAALCNLFVDYLAHFSPRFAEPAPRALVVCTVVAALTAVNLIGVRRAALVGNVFTVGKLLPLLLFVAVGVFAIDPARLALPPAPSYDDFSKALLLLVFAFTGFESAVVPAGESRDPRRDLPFAALTALAVIAPLYVLVQLVCIGTLPGLAESPRPLADAAAGFMGSAGAALITIGALVSIGGTLSAIMLAAPRVLYAMAELDQLPRLLGATHARWRTPHVAIVLSGLAVLVATLSGSFITAVAISTIARLLVYAATCAAVPVLRRRDAGAEAAFRAPGGSLTAVAALLLIAWLLSNGSAVEVRNVAIVAVVGLGIFIAHRALFRGAPEPRETKPPRDS